MFGSSREQLQICVSVFEVSGTPAAASSDCQLSSAAAHSSLDCNSLQDSIQESLQVLFKILAIQKSGDLHKIALDWVTTLHSLSEYRPLAGLIGGT